MVKSEASKKTYDIREVAQILGIGQTLAYDAARRGEIPVLRIGGRYVVPRERFQKWLAGEEIL